MKRINFFVVVMCILFLFFLNVSYSNNDTPVNIVVIIDTSDRVSEERHPDQRERDISILTEIFDQFYNLFKDEVKTGKIKKHKLNFVVPEQPGISDPPNDIIDKFTIVAPKDRDENQAFEKKKDELINAIPKLYDHVQQHPQTGSDIWDWFRSKAASFFLKNHHNLIICLSDGYLNFDIDIEANRPKGTYMKVGTLRSNSEAVNKIKNGSEGLHPVKNFDAFNIKFLMLEIRLREENGVKHFRDFDIIQAYWETWLNDMGIKDTKFLEQLGTGGLKNEIEKFIQLK